MGTINKLFGACRQAATTFFAHDLKLTRGEKGVKLVLQAPGSETPAAAVDPNLAREQRRQRAELARMLRELDTLFAEHPQSARTFPHLAYFRQQLKSSALEAFRQTPLDVLRKALAQFEGVVSNWSSAGLATLRSKMAVAILERENLPSGDPSCASAADSGLGDPGLPSVDTQVDAQQLYEAYSAIAPTEPAPFRAEPELHPSATDTGKPSHATPA